ncbi:hypothetical protein [Vibrio natriegens]|uniref:hypothetical protein n=1 Tax=Vibrio natriegens TaxID=691 RepID=UPI003B5CF57A
MKTNNNVIDINGILFLQQKDRAQEQFAYLSGEKNVSKNVIEKFNLNIKTNLEISSKQGFKYKHIVFQLKPLLSKNYSQFII